MVDAAIKGRIGLEAEQAILDLRVCDPAVGSGHFLVGAAHRLARHLARIRANIAGDSEPSPRLHQQALRDVIGHCLYGVDINPMAAELCRVGLWLEAMEPGKPLTFLDHHIRVGNSLLGTTSEFVAAGLPDDCFKPIAGDNKKTCNALRKRNRVERESGQQDMEYRMVAEPRAEYNAIASRSRAISQAPDDTLHDVRSKADQFEQLLASSQYRRQQRVADAWCAAFVWPKSEDIGSDSLTTDTLRRVDKDAGALSSTQQVKLERLTGQHGFFHWHLAFPEVFANGGFDCVLGNPPWEQTELKEKEWFSDLRPDIAKASIGAERKRLIEALKQEDADLYCAFESAQRQHDSLGHFLRNSGRFPFCGRGRINLYAVFAELIRSLINSSGRMGCVCQPV